jgi:hypothetical protein
VAGRETESLDFNRMYARVMRGAIEKAALKSSV